MRKQEVIDIQALDQAINLVKETKHIYVPSLISVLTTDFPFFDINSESYPQSIEIHPSSAYLWDILPLISPEDIKVREAACCAPTIEILNLLQKLPEPLLAGSDNTRTSCIASRNFIPYANNFRIIVCFILLLPSSPRKEELSIRPVEALIYFLLLVFFN